MNRILLTAVTALLLNAGAACANPFDDVNAAYSRGDYATTVAKLRPLAAQGSALAQYNLGWMYNKGQGVAQDYAAAVKWYRLSATQGYASAQFGLGLMYDLGRGVAQDYAAAVKWYRLSAEQGNAGAQLNLGLMYVEGQGVTQDYVWAHMWFNVAAANGNANAVKNRNFIATGMTTQQIAEAQKMARDCQARNFKGCD